MQFEFTAEQTEIERIIGGHRHINAFGRIEHGDAGRLRSLLEKAGIPPSTTVYIASSGGDVEESIELGYLIREFGLETSIGSYVLGSENDDALIARRTFSAGACMSAATLMFAGGRLRHFPDGASFGVHRFSYGNPTPADVERSQVLSARIARFLDDMGVSLGFLSLSAGVPSSGLLEMSEGELREHRMVTGGMTDVVWGTEMRANTLYVRGTRDSIFGRHKVMLAHRRDAGFMFIAVIEAQGRHRELTGLGVVEIVVNGEEHRIDISARCSRQANDMDVILLACLTDEEARRIAYSDSFGVQIRVTTEAGVFLGVGAMETEGGRDALRSLYGAMQASAARGS